MAEYIEREALIREIISNMASFIGTPDEVQKHDEQCNYAILCIEDALSVDVVPVAHGRWAHIGGDEWACTNCGFVITTEGSWESPEKKYCENCGAKMAGGNSDE